MTHPRLTEFLLKLATDPATLEKYQHANERERNELLEAAGLNTEQRKAILSANTRQITEQVAEELKKVGNVTHAGHDIIHLQISVQLPQSDK